jgi:hypothetical protein
MTDGTNTVTTNPTPVVAEVDNRITIQFNGKDVKVTPIQPGVVQRTKSIYYVQDSVTKEWLYCFPERLAKLLAKYNGDLSGYTGRASSKVAREAAKLVKKQEMEAKAKLRAEETAAAAQKIKDDAEAARLKAAATGAEAPPVVPAPQTSVGPDTSEDDLAKIAVQEEAEAKAAKKVAAKKK